jgi:hypothetical protein
MNAPVISPAVSACTAVSVGTAGDTGWSATIDACHGLLAIALGTNNMDDTFDRACRDADRKTASRPVDARTLRARRLLADDDISYERAYHETLRDRSAPEATIDALVYSLRRGINELTSPEAKRRLSELSEDQLRALCERLRNFKPEIAPAWTPEEVEALTVIWSELK